MMVLAFRRLAALHHELDNQSLRGERLDPRMFISMEEGVRLRELDSRGLGRLLARELNENDYETLLALDENNDTSTAHAASETEIRRLPTHTVR